MAKKRNKTWPQNNTRLGSSLSAVILNSPSWAEPEYKCGKETMKNNKKHGRRHPRLERSNAPLRFLDPGA
ncbi:hypothetical protein NDU88_003764 [Pleurodeles waltl]|uniref:Uncharacterized protein n=1 Tax=Pleurodeles waltl TaxID=8319 RepID=A0AAV7M828_PLEWA|nr:hypothetical protein NDU88_003764 [Pleurodeles waltl]